LDLDVRSLGTAIALRVYQPALAGSG
jgi:hypothetical protein